MNHDVLFWALLAFIDGLVFAVFTCIAVVCSDMSRPAKHESISLWAGISIANLFVAGFLFVAAHVTLGFQWVS